jgi:hypothetical protein
VREGDRLDRFQFSTPGHLLREILLENKIKLHLPATASSIRLARPYGKVIRIRFRVPYPPDRQLVDFFPPDPCWRSYLAQLENTP